MGGSDGDEMIICTSTTTSHQLINYTMLPATYGMLLRY